MTTHAFDLTRLSSRLPNARKPKLKLVRLGRPRTSVADDIQAAVGRVTLHRHIAGDAVSSKEASAAQNVQKLRGNGANQVVVRQVQDPERDSKQTVHNQWHWHDPSRLGPHISRVHVSHHLQKLRQGRVLHRNVAGELIVTQVQCSERNQTVPVSHPAGHLEVLEVLQENKYGAVRLTGLESIG